LPISFSWLKSIADYLGEHRHGLYITRSADPLPDQVVGSGEKRPQFELAHARDDGAEAQEPSGFRTARGGIVSTNERR
jgi:hypothetical protein